MRNLARLPRLMFVLALVVLLGGAGIGLAGRAAAEDSAPAAMTPRLFMPIVSRSPAPPSNPTLLWRHLSSATGDLPSPGASPEQVVTLVGDLNRDGRNDFIIATRQQPGPAVVWYERLAGGGWARRVLESEALPIEAGGALFDIDRDGDLDLALGANGQGNQIWWWENPAPAFDNGNWQRRLIKNSGQNRHHDMMFGQFDDDPGIEFIFWNQGALRLYAVDVPTDPRATQPWPNARPIFTAPGTGLEGMAQADVDLDGRNDIIAGGRWFRYQGGGRYAPELIDDVKLARIAAGQLKPGGRPEIVITPGDDDGPARWYEWDGGRWVAHDLLDGPVFHAHSLDLDDANGDGRLDIFVAEMAFNEDDSNGAGREDSNPEARAWVFLGDGQGAFTPSPVSVGMGHHESRLADLDGDGDLDILGKPFSWRTPRLDIWLNEGQSDRCATPPPVAEWTWQRHLIDPARPGRATFAFPFDVNQDGQTDFITGKFWYANPGSAGGDWTRNPLPAPIEDTIAVHDFDNDGDLDLLATTGPTLPNEAGYWWPVVWARNEGGARFTVFQNLDNSGVTIPPNDPIQGVAIARFTPGGPLQVAMTWDDTENPARDPYGVQVFTVPPDPTQGTWARQKLSDVSVGEELSAADLDGDGDLDLFMGNKWLRNEGAGAPWTPITIFNISGKLQTSRHELHDIDGDGDLDAFVGFSHSPEDRRVVWFEHPQDPTSLWPVHAVGSLDKGAAESLDAVDLDGDGDLDIVAGEYYVRYTEERPGATLWIFENLGGGLGWARHRVYTGDSHYQSSRAVDVDSDGDYDVIAKGWFKNEVYLYENTTNCPVRLTEPAAK